MEIYKWQVMQNNFSMINVNFNLKNYTKKDGKNQVILVLTSNGKRKRLALDIFCEKNKWDKKKQRIKGVDELNLLIDQAEAKITDIKIHYKLSNTTLSLDKLVEEFRDSTPSFDFCKFH